MPWKVTRKSIHDSFQLLLRLSLTAGLSVVLTSCGTPAPESLTISDAPTTSPTSSIPLPPPEPAPVEALAPPVAEPPVEPAPQQPLPAEPPQAEPPPPADLPARSACDESYPSVCIPPAPPDLDCDDIPHGGFQVLPPDPHNFDGRDRDGIGCESN
jgi:hypothetical protein